MCMKLLLINTKFLTTHDKTYCLKQNILLIKKRIAYNQLNCRVLTRLIIKVASLDVFNTCILF